MIIPNSPTFSTEFQKGVLLLYNCMDQLFNLLMWIIMEKVQMMLSNRLYKKQLLLFFLPSQKNKKRTEWY